MQLIRGNALRNKGIPSDHRGQLSLYLRLNDIRVPAIYGPSADDEGRSPENS